LRKDARQSYTQLEIKSGINHLTVRKYISKLEEDGIILGYSPDLSLENIQNLYILLFKVREIGKETIDDFNNNVSTILDNLDNFRLIDFYSTLGEYQFVFVVGCDSLNDLNIFIEYLKKTFQGLGDYILLNGIRTNFRGSHLNLK